MNMREARISVNPLRRAPEREKEKESDSLIVAAIQLVGPNRNTTKGNEKN